MPATYTHKRFGEEVYNKLDMKIQEEIKDNKEVYLIFNHSFDSLFFYKVFSLSKGKDIRDLGHYAHDNKINLYFKNILLYLKENYTNEGASYLFGSINHYVLDSTMHPYIFYKTGVFDNKKIDTYKYNGLHTKLESDLDKFFYSLDNKEGNINCILQEYSFPVSLMEMIDYVFKKTFEVDFMGGKFSLAYKSYKRIHTLFFIDNHGCKKKVYRVIDKLSGEKNTNIVEHSFFMGNIDVSLFNIEKRIWYNPKDNKIKSNKSIFDLYNDSLEKSLSLIAKCYQYLLCDYDLESLLNDIGNNSYLTGLDESIRGKMKFFQ